MILQSMGWFLTLTHWMPVLGYRRKKKMSWIDDFVGRLLRSIQFKTYFSFQYIVAVSWDCDAIAWRWTFILIQNGAPTSPEWIVQWANTGLWLSAASTSSWYSSHKALLYLNSPPTCKQYVITCSEKVHISCISFDLIWSVLQCHLY